MFFENLAFILPSFQQFLLKRILVFSHKMVFIENEAVLLCVTMREGARASTCSYNLVYNFLIYLLPLKSSVFVVHFSNAFWHGKEAFQKGSSQNEIVPLLVIFHFPCSKYIGVLKYVFIRVIIKIKIFHSCRTRVFRVALVLHSCHICVACAVNQTRSFKIMIFSKVQFQVNFQFSNIVNNAGCDNHQICDAFNHGDFNVFGTTLDLTYYIYIGQSLNCIYVFSANIKIALNSRQSSFFIALALTLI